MIEPSAIAVKNAVEASVLDVRRPAKMHLPTLDGIRGIAILMVMCGHLVDGTLAMGSREARLVLALIHTGWAGVDLFFVLSGFLITGILLDNRGDPHYFRNFYARRTLRIFPLYYGVLTIAFVVLPLMFKSPGQGFGELASLQAWLWLYGTNLYVAWRGGWPFTSQLIWLNHFWSLSVEEHFYLVWPAVVLICARRKTLAATCVAIAVAVLTARIFCIEWGVSPVALYVLTPLRIDSLALGGLAAVVARGPGGIVAIVRPACWGLALAGVALLILFTRGNFGGNGEDQGRALLMTPLAIFFTSAIVLVVAADVVGSGPAKQVARSVGHPVLRMFGRYSYGLYVFESLLQPVFEKWFSTRILMRSLHNYTVAGFAHLVLSISATLLVAVASFHIYESPFLRLKRLFPSAGTNRRRLLVAKSA